MVAEFKSIIDLLKAFPTEQSCIDHLEKLMWDGNPVSPFDTISKVYKCAGNKYKCKSTGKYFNVRTNTIFDNTKIPLQKWFLALYVFLSHNKGISSHQLAKDIDVTQKSAWFLLHRLRYAFDHPGFKNSFGNVEELDETFVRGKSKSKHTSKKKKNEQGHTIHDKATVLSMRERDGNIIARVVEGREKESIIPVVCQNVENETVVMTDEYSAYNDLKADYTHFKVNNGAKEYVNEMEYTNGIENFWSNLKKRY